MLTIRSVKIREKKPALSQFPVGPMTHQGRVDLLVRLKDVPLPLSLMSVKLKKPQDTQKKHAIVTRISAKLMVGQPEALDPHPLIVSLLPGLPL